MKRLFIGVFVALVTTGFVMSQDPWDYGQWACVVQTHGAGVTMRFKSGTEKWVSASNYRNGTQAGFNPNSCGSAAAPTITMTSVAGSAATPAVALPRVTGRTDPLGLENAHVEVENRIAVVVPAAIGEGQTTSYGSLNFSYHGGTGYGFRGDSAMGTSLQRSTQQILNGKGYSALAPRTGGQGTDLVLIQDESAGTAGQVSRRAPEYIVVVSYGFTEAKTSSFGVRGSGAGRAIPGGRIRDIVRTVGFGKASAKIGAKVDISFYTLDGQLLKSLEAKDEETLGSIMQWGVLGVSKEDRLQKGLQEFAESLVEKALP